VSHAAFRNILVINVTRIGDTLLTTPALRAIAAAYPEAKITVLAHPKRAEVLYHLPFVARLGAISKKSALWRGWLARLTKYYDLAIVYGYDDALVAYALRVARKVVAFRQKDKRLNARLSVCVEPPAFQSDHAVRLALALPRALGVAPSDLRLAYTVTAMERDWAEATRATDIPAASYPLVGLQVASFPTKAYRDWPIESFMELCERIGTHWPRAHFLIFGGTVEHKRTSALKLKLGAVATLYAGKLSLRQTGALMSQLDLYVGVDTGPTHLMSTFNIPMIGLYHGSSRSELIAPLEHPHFFPIDHPRAGPDCPTDASMADISVDCVWNAVTRALDR